MEKERGNVGFTFADLIIRVHLCNHSSHLFCAQIAREMGDNFKPPGPGEMAMLFQLCRDDDWEAVTKAVHDNPFLAISPIVMDNHITTTIMHQAITSKATGDTRTKLIEFIIENTPAAAAIKNGYGSLPLHVICQRNTKIKAKVKESLILRLCEVYPGAMEESGGVGQRTPLHIIFTGK